MLALPLAAAARGTGATGGVTTAGQTTGYTRRFAACRSTIVTARACSTRHVESELLAHVRIGSRQSAPILENELAAVLALRITADAWSMVRFVAASNSAVEWLVWKERSALRAVSSPPRRRATRATDGPLARWCVTMCKVAANEMESGVRAMYAV